MSFFKNRFFIFILKVNNRLSSLFIISKSVMY